MKKFSISTLVGLLVLLVSHGVGAQTTIDFNSVGDNQGYGLSYAEGGFVFSINDPGGGRQIVGKEAMGYLGSNCLYDNNPTPGGITRWTIRKADNGAFQFRGIYLRDAGFADESGVIWGYKGGVAIGSAPASFSRTANAPLDFSANPIFFDVDEIRIEAADINFYLDHFTYGDPFSVGDDDPAEVLSIALVGNPVSTETAVSYTVTFSKDAYNVDVTDFELTTTGSVTANLASLTGASGSTTYTAAINNIAGEGSLRLDLKANTDIENEDDVDGTAAFTGGQEHYVGSCFTETFDQGETNGATTFSGNGKTFTLTGNWTVNTDSPVNGLGGSAFNLKNNGSGPYTITLADGVVSVPGLYLYLSSQVNGAEPTNDGSMTIRGLRSGSEVYSFTKISGFATDHSTHSGYTYIDFSAEDSENHADKLIDQLEITMGGSFVYLNLDNFSWCLDFAPPAGYTVTIDQDPITLTNETAVSFTFAGAEIGTTYNYTFTSTGGGAPIAGSGTILTLTDQITNIDLSGLDAGTVTLSVTLTDASGNEGSAVMDEVEKIENNAPVATPPTAPTAVEEDSEPIALADDIEVADIDGDDQTLTFTITGGVVTLGTSGITFGGDGNGSGSFTASGTLTDINAALDAATFTPTPDFFGTATIAFVANDGYEDSNEASVSFTVTGVNDAPTISGLPASITIIEDTPGNLDIASSSFADIDSDEITVTLSVSAGTIGLAAPGGIPVTLNGIGTSTVTIAGTPSAINTYVDIPTNMIYTPPANLNGDVAAILTVMANDGDGSGDVELGTVPIDITAVNDAPVITTSTGNTVFTEPIAGSPEPVIIDAGLTVEDVDNTTLVSGRVSIETANFQSDQDVLAFENNESNMGDIDGSYNPTTGVLTLSSPSGTATVAQWETALRAVTYSNSSSDPNTTNRTVSFVVNDDSDESAAATKIIEVEAVNNAPTISNLDGDGITFTEKDPAILLDAGGDANVTDPDSDAFDGGNLTVSITDNGVAGEDVLGIRDEGTSAGQIGISGSSVTYGGTTIGTFSGGTALDDLVVLFNASATPAAAQALIRNLTYNNSNTTNPSTAMRTVSVTVNDGGEATSLPSEVTITIAAVNDEPIVTTSGGSTTFTEVAGDTPVPVAIDAGITISDPDNTTLASATVVITGDFQSGQDLLSFTNDDSTMGNIGASYDSGSGVLTLTSASAIATLDEWQAALREVTYSNTSKAPNTANRTITFVVNDGEDDSNPETKTISVTDVNDPPTIAAPTAIEVVEDEYTGLTGISFADVDAGAGVVEATFSIPSDRGELQAVVIGGVALTLTGSHTVALEGTLSAINSYVAAGNLRFRNSVGDLDNVQLTVAIDDRGNTGGGGPQTANEAVTITVRSMVPRIARVYSPDSDGHYGLGSSITIHVEFDREVIATEVGDGIRLLLATGVPGRFASYTAGSGEETLIFQYTVQPGDENTHLDYLNTGALELAIGSTIESLEAGVGTDLTLPALGAVESLSGSNHLAVDGIAPTALAKDITLALDADGVAVLLPVDLDDGSSDNLTLSENLVFTASQTTVDCSHVGPIEVTLTVTDEAGNETTTTAIVTVLDENAPRVLIRNLIVALDAEGQATITPEMVDEGSDDACGIATLVLSKTTFNSDDLGSNTVTLTAIDQNGNESDAILATVIVVAFENHSFVYDGTAKSLSIAGELPNGVEVSYVDNGQTEAGTYMVMANIDGGADFNDLMLTAELEITQASLIDIITFDDGSFVYNGTARSLAISGDLPDGTEVTYTGNGQTEVGAYTVTASIHGGNNYEELVLTAELAISKALLVGVITFDDGSFVYDGTARSLAISGDLPDGTEVTYTGNGQTEVDTYTVTATIDGGNNYEELVLTAELEITQASLVGVITFDDGSFVYDGTSRSLAISGDLPAGTEVTYTGNGQTEAGAYTVTASIDGGNNYEELVLTATLEIIAAPEISVTFPSGSFVYDGTQQSLAIVGELPEGVTVTYTNNGRVDVGVQTVTATINGGNSHQDMVLTATLEITHAARTLDLPALSAKTYGDADFNADGTASSGETVTYTSSDESVAEIVDGLIRITGAGSVTITATVPENGNYSSRPTASQVLVVHKATQSITFAEVGEVSRDAGNIQLVVSASSGLPVSLVVDDEQVATLSGNTLTIHRLGTVRITATQAGDANHETAESVTITVRVVDPASSFPVRVHQAVSPNGDGINEFLIIEGIRDYPENRVTILNRNGTIVWEASGYDNGTVAFRGIGTGQLRLPAGTYFYIVEVKDTNGRWEHHKGYFVLRY